MDMITYALWAMPAFMMVYAWRVFRGPSVWDRLLGVALISAKVILFIVLFSSLRGTAYLLDIALIYALLSFAGIIFTARFLAAHKGEKK